MQSLQIRIDQTSRHICVVFVPCYVCGSCGVLFQLKKKTKREKLARLYESALSVHLKSRFKDPAHRKHVNETTRGVDGAFPLVGDTGQKIQACPKAH